ncbi:MAG: UPF0182 family protein [Candidatus Ancillula trichonymphae]|nr:UPF0182 family protein [Candidatus Ancillula trichonymphae]
MPTNLITILIMRLVQKYSSTARTSGPADSSSNNEGEQERTRYDFSKLKSAPAYISKQKKKVTAVGLTLGAVAFLVVAVVLAAVIIPDILWCSNLGYLNVLFIKYFAPAVVFLAGFISAFAVSLVSLFLVFKTRVQYQVAQISPNQLEDVKSSIAKQKNKWFVMLSVVIGVIFGLILLGSTNDFLLLFGSNPFGIVDPIFSNDISFYVFVLPGLRSIIGALLALLVVMLLLSLFEGAVFGQATFTHRRVRFGQVNLLTLARPLRMQLSIYCALIMLLTGVRVFLSRYSILSEVGERITGPGWTDVNIRIPVQTSVAALFLVSAVLFVVVGFRASVKLPLFALGGVAVVAVVAGLIVPAVVQNFKVTPNAQELEKTYIAHNIAATGRAFGIGGVDAKMYDATTEASRGALRKDAETTAQIRLLDPQIVAPTIRQLQQNKQYYSFQDTVSVDKYNFDGKSHDTLISAREIDLSGNDQRNWINDHTVFTHGFGIVAAYGNQVTNDGRPQFFEKDIPTSGNLTKSESYEPRIYFSKNAPDYSITGGKDGTSWEFDYPEADETTTFAGNGGPKISDPLIKLLYAIKFGSYQIFFSDRVTSNSQILYDRDPALRVQKVAPYLTLDGRVYPAVIDSRVKWIVDGYTTTDKYPYSTKINLANATKDTLTETSKSNSSLDSEVANYIRNSVKATVDAYDGSVVLYAWDPEDPILRAWSKIYGSNLRPISEISGSLMSHIRYPENLFKVQRSMLSKYHVNQAAAFFSGEDFWQVPTDPTTGGSINSKYGSTETGVKQPPYYLTLQMPDQQTPVFSLTSSFIPGGGSNRREILTGFLSADSDAGSTPGVIGPNYGKLRLLELPKNTTVPGPGQAQNNFNSNADVSKELNLLSSGSSRVERGNLLTLPIGGGLVYVQPVYVSSTGTTSFPLLKKVLVAFGDKVGFANTLDGALNQVFSGDSGAHAGDAQNDGAGAANQPPSSGSSAQPAPDLPNDGSSSTPNSVDDAMNKALEDAKTALEKAQKSLEEIRNKIFTIR